MKLSGEQVLRVAQLGPMVFAPGAGSSSGSAAVATLPSVGTIATAPARRPALPVGDSFPVSEEARRVAGLAAEGEEVREQVVASLRAQIEAGDYFVTGEQIAEMMVRRFLADRVR